MRRPRFMKHRRMLAGLDLSRADRERILYGYERSRPTTPQPPRPARPEPTMPDEIVWAMLLVGVLGMVAAFCGH